LRLFVDSSTCQTEGIYANLVDIHVIYHQIYLDIYLNPI
jgi:hypothetical protein